MASETVSTTVDSRVALMVAVRVESSAAESDLLMADSMDA